MTNVDFVERLRTHAAAQVRRPAGRLDHARLWFPRPMAIMDALLSEAQRLYPHAAIGISAATREGNPDAVFLRIGAHAPRKRRVGRYIEVSVFPDEMFWDAHDLGAGFLRGEDDSDAERRFGEWLLGKLCALTEGLHPIGLRDAEITSASN